jgi:hypothetical protein
MRTIQQTKGRWYLSNWALRWGDTLEVLWFNQWYPAQVRYDWHTGQYRLQIGAQAIPLIAGLFARYVYVAAQAPHQRWYSGPKASGLSPQIDHE